MVGGCPGRRECQLSSRCDEMGMRCSHLVQFLQRVSMDSSLCPFSCAVELLSRSEAMVVADEEGRSHVNSSVAFSSRYDHHRLVVRILCPPSRTADQRKECGSIKQQQRSMATPASDPALVASPRLTSTSARSSPLIPPPPAPAPSAASSSLTSASPTAAARRPSVHLARSNSDRSHQPTSPRGFIATAVATYELRQGSDGEGEEEGYGQRGSRFSFNVDEDDVELLSDEEEATTLLNSASAAGTSSASSSPTKASSSTSGTGTAATHHARSGSGSIGTGAGGRTARREALRKHPKEGIDSEWRSRGAGLLAGIANMSNSYVLHSLPLFMLDLTLICIMLFLTF